MNPAQTVKCGEVDRKAKALFMGFIVDEYIHWMRERKEIDKGDVEEPRRRFHEAVGRKAKVHQQADYKTSVERRRIGSR